MRDSVAAEIDTVISRVLQNYAELWLTVPGYDRPAGSNIFPPTAAQSEKKRSKESGRGVNGQPRSFKVAQAKEIASDTLTAQGKNLGVVWGKSLIPRKFDLINKVRV